MAGVINRCDCIIKKSTFRNERCARKRIYHRCEEQIEKSPSGSQSGITRQAEWCQTVILGMVFPMIDPYITTCSCVNNSWWCVANSVDPDHMLHSPASNLGLHCLLKPVYLNTLGKYGKGFNITIFTKSIQTHQLLIKLVLKFEQVQFTTQCCV